jgi:hypothetical protein
VCVIQTGGELILFTSEPAKNQFNGVLVCHGKLTVNNVHINGNIIAGGEVVLNGSADIHHEPSRIFGVHLPEPAKQDLFDLLQLTNFSRLGGGDVTNIEALLGSLSFDLEGSNGKPCLILINNFDDIAPTMVKSKKIAN